MVFPVLMYGCESWTIKKAEGWRIDAFELWCWRRLLRVPWTAKRSNQSILKGISPEYSLEGLMLKLKLQYLGHLMRRTDSLEKILKLGKTEGRRRRGQQRVRWLDGITVTMSEQTPGVGDGQGSLACCSPWCHKESDTTDRLNWPTPVFLGFPGGSDSKESSCNVGDLGSIPGLGRSPGEGTGNPLQYSCLENPHGQRNLAVYSPWGHKESDVTEWLSTSFLM